MVDEPTDPDDVPAGVVRLRIVSAAALLAALVTSVACGRGVIWAAYLTHWTMILQTAHALALAYATVYETGARVPATALTRTVAFVMSTLVTLVYWVAVHDWVAPLWIVSLVEHGFGTAVATLDVLTSGAHPGVRVRLSHVGAVYAFGGAYLAWSLAFYGARLHDKEGHRYLYVVLDWNHGARIVVNVLGLAVCVVPALVFLLDKLQTVGHWMVYSRPDKQEEYRHVEGAMGGSGSGSGSGNALVYTTAQCALGEVHPGP